jgi:hypothetical protein
MNGVIRVTFERDVRTGSRHPHVATGNFLFNGFIDLGGRYPAKFVEARPVGYFGAWGGLRYLGDSNPVWNSVVKFNGRV